MELYKRCTEISDLSLRGKSWYSYRDGAFDSHWQGEFCTYTLISKASQKVLSTVTVPRSLTGSSANLEEIGLFQALMDLPAAVLDKIKTVCTDESPSIVKKMREINDQRIQDGKATIEHAHCVWHRDKNISSKVSSFFSTAGGSAVKNWTSSIRRHWYYSCENARNGEELREMVLAIPKYICDVHSFPDKKHFKECSHK